MIAFLRECRGDGPAVVAAVVLAAASLALVWSLPWLLP